MKTLQKLLLPMLVLASVSGFTQKSSGIAAKDLKKHVAFLASDSLKGRKPGMPETNIAAKYILEQFRSYGLIPAGEEGFQTFEIVTDVALGPGNMLEGDGVKGTVTEDFIPLSYSFSGHLEAPVVFAGFGFDLDLDSLKWNDFRSVDITGKWIMIFRGDPEPDISDSRFIPFSDTRAKILTAKDKGAGGVLLVSPKSVEKEDKLIPFVTENNEMTSGIPVISIKRSLADQILERKGAVDSLEKLIIRGKTPVSFVTGVPVKGAADVQQKRAPTTNVVAVLPGSDPVLKNEFLVVGAHYDHLGYGGPGSGSRRPDTTAVHNGADDNASGTAMLIEVAGLLSKQQKELKRTIIFVAFSAEEIGLMGSRYFISHPLAEMKKITAMFNFDMVGRFDSEKNAISVGGTGTSAEGDSILRQSELGLPFMVTHSSDGIGPSDHAAFFTAGIPVFYFTTGVHTDYHTPFDDTGKLNFKKEAKIGDFAAGVIMKIDRMEKPLTFRESGKKEGSGRSGRRLKVTLGIMPDFAGTEKKGLRVDGVTKDGPADKGGMKKGDIIISLNGMKVENIYEYMSRLQKLRPGQTVSAEVIRGTKNEVLLIQL